jgi:hypothetical protein
VPPALITRTSASEDTVKYHVWWLLEPTADFDLWERVERALIARYGGDPKCALWTQVGRVAGFWHQKDRDHPCEVLAVQISEDAPRWPLAEFAERMALDLDSVPVRSERDGPAVKEPEHGWDDDVDVARARNFLGVETNWYTTSDGGVSVFKMACHLRELGISPELAEELICEFLPVPPLDSWRADHIEQKVANAYRYASGDAGSASSVASRAAFDAAPFDEERVDHGAETAADDDEAIALLELVERDDAALLYEGPNIALLARLKQTARDRYEALLVIWRKRRVAGLRELDKAVDRYIKQAAEAARAEGGPAVNSVGFACNEKGEILVTQENIRLAISKLGVTLRYDSFQGCPIIEGMEGFGPALDDHAMNRLWLDIDATFGFRPRLEFFQIVVSDACRRDAFHPVLDYLDGLEWDETERLDDWLVRFCGADDTEYVRAVGRLVLLAAVRRVRQPGAKFDELLILESDEGHDKSSMLAELAVREEWFSDSLPLSVDDKRMIEGHTGKWIIEIAELQGMRKGEVEKIKAQLSRRRDRARLAYGRLPVEVARQCVFIATHNPAPGGGGYLKSLTGNRRFWPVRVNRIDLAAFKRDRDQLWAEASEREKAGEGIRLSPSLWQAAAAEQAEREEVNPLLDVLARHLSGCQGVLFSVDAWELTGIPVTQRAAFNEKLGKAMRALGWERRKRRRTPGGDQEWAYVKGEETVQLKVKWSLDRREPLVTKERYWTADQGGGE